MNSKDVSDKIKKDLVIIEGKLLNHKAFRVNSEVFCEEADDIRSLTRTYQDMLCDLNLNKEDYNYCILRCEAMDVIYEQIKIRSQYYLDHNHNQFYKKIMDAFNNTIGIYDYYNSEIKKLKKILNEITLNKDTHVDDIIELFSKLPLLSNFKILEAKKINAEYIKKLFNQKINRKLSISLNINLQDAFIFLSNEFLKDIPFHTCLMEDYNGQSLAIPYEMSFREVDTVEDLFDKLLNLYNEFEMLIYDNKIEIVKIEKTDKIKFI